MGPGTPAGEYLRRFWQPVALVRDRGVIMLRRIVRDGIRAVARGADPRGTREPEGRPVWTFAQDVVLRIPPASTPEEDRPLLRATGRQVVGLHLAPAGADAACSSRVVPGP